MFASVAGAWFLVDRFAGIVWQVDFWDFRNNLWGPAHLLCAGRSPYDLTRLFANGQAVWLPPTIGALAWLGWLPFTAAATTWVAASLVALLALPFLVSDNQPGPLRLAVAWLLIFLFQPAVIHLLRLGQAAALATALFLVVFHYRRRWPPPLVALLLAATLGKPQLGLLFIPGMVLLAGREQGRRAAISLAGWLVVWLVALSLPVVGSPGRWSDFLDAQRANPAWMQPSLRALLASWLGKWPGTILWLLLAVALGIVALRLWWRQPPLAAALWALALTPVVSPYIWTWDFVLLLPLIVYLVVSGRRPRVAVGTAVVCTAIWTASLATALDGNAPNHAYWWIPWATLPLVLLLWRWENPTARPEADERARPAVDA